MHRPNWVMASDESRHEASTALLRAMFDQAHRMSPDELGPVVDRAAREIGAADTQIYLADYARQRLVPLPGAHRTAEAVEPLDIDTTVAGRAYMTQEVIVGEVGRDGRVPLLLPMIDGTERVGVLHLTVREDTEFMIWICVQLATVVAELIASKDRAGDFFISTRRLRDMNLAAEMQWQLLPPMQIASGNVVIAGLLEPAYEVGGDAFDFAINGDEVHIAIIDAMGHGVAASVMCNLTVNAYRHARRSGLDLLATTAAMDEAFTEQFGAGRFATAQVGVLDRPTGSLRWINAGHPPPLLVHNGEVIGPLPCDAALPIGLNEVGARTVNEHHLEPGDRVFFYSDGMVEARDGSGELFGLDQLIVGLNKALLAYELPSEILRQVSQDVMDHQSSPHQDDATIVMLEWQGPGEAGVKGIVK